MTQKLATLYALKDGDLLYIGDIALDVCRLTGQPPHLHIELSKPGRRIYQNCSQALTEWRDIHGFTENYQVNTTIKRRGEWKITQAGIDYLIRHPDL
ncbi:MAG: hypothetical protein OXD54_06775 [Candidatus Poribacteria bacterium]|nr:hypothetical protein [Candidatus Poribacteria bacterium]